MARFITVCEENTKSGIYEFSKEINIEKKSIFSINLFASERYIQH